ncbi:Cell cycle protein [Rugamonas rubra]|uniref:Cell cycle protein n=2 Tax=Rugamonas rubra TaxID=758825 RepID=A0A1I4TBR1_9BURK|nr:Cell cycle protein [Rugamonas rubra]
MAAPIRSTPRASKPTRHPLTSPDRLAALGRLATQSILAALGRLLALVRLPLPAGAPAPASARIGGRLPLSWLSGALGGMATLARRHAAIAATVALLLLLCALQGLALWRAPPAWHPAAVTVRLAPGESITLGQRELAAPQADKAHLTLRRDPRDGWMLRNLSAAKQVVLQGEAGEQRMGSVALRGGQRFQVGHHRFDVLSASADEVAFSRDGVQWRYDGAVLYRDGHALPACADAHLAARALALWNRWLPRPLSIARALAFGGNVHCDNRLGLAGVTSGAALLARAGADGPLRGQLQLSAGSPDGERGAVLLLDGARQTDLRQQELPLAGVHAIIAGHSRLLLSQQEEQLNLQPTRRVTLFNVAELKLPAQVDWQWRPRALWHNPASSALWAGLALCLALLAATALLAARGVSTSKLAPSVRLAPSTAQGRTGADDAIPPARQASGQGQIHAGPWRTRLTWFGTIVLLLCGLAALLLQRAGSTPSAACSLLLASGALLWWLALPGRLTLASAAAVILLAAGLLSQLDLGLGANEVSWLRYYQKSCALLAIGAGLGGLWRLWAAQRGALLPQRATEWALAVFAAVALAGLAAEVLWGDETGVFDLQPVELAKLALTCLTAHCLALRLGWQSGPRRLAEHGARWLRLIAPALLFLALLGLALVQVDDYSPLILLLLWSAAMMLAYGLASGNRLLVALPLLAALLAAAAIAWLRLASIDVDADSAGQWPQNGGFYADRFQVWLAPARHPHTGQQLLLGARAIAEGGWWGGDGLLGLRSLGQGAGAALRIPAVQDDFAPAFFLNRHGLLGALLLWTAQAALLAGLLWTAARSHAAGAAPRGFRQAWAGRFRYFTLCGGAALLFGHLLLSWGTNLAIFPIMGQPMSFLSAGGSHLLFFLLPLLSFAAISAQSLEENEPCRSMSNTKC